MLTKLPGQAQVLPTQKALSVLPLRLDLPSLSVPEAFCIPDTFPALP